MNSLSFQIIMLSKRNGLNKGLLFSLAHCGFFLLKKGTVTITSNQEIYQLEEGSLYIYFPSTSICITYISEDAEGIILENSLDDILPVINRVISSENLLLIRSSPCVKLEPWEYKKIIDTITELDKRYNEDNSELLKQQKKLHIEIIKSMLQTLCYEMFFIYYSHAPVQPRQSDKRTLIFQHFMLNLYQYYKIERDVAFYASQQNLSERYFSSLIKNVSGHTASFWIIQLVIAEAKRLLEINTISIKEIAFELNFSTQSFFGRYFKHYTGMSPQNYRKESLILGNKSRL